MSREDAIGAGVAILMFFGFPFAVWACGGMFHQRCEKAYPDNPAAQERCIMRLSGGGPVYESNEGYKP